MFDALKSKWKTFFWYVGPAAQVSAWTCSMWIAIKLIIIFCVNFFYNIHLNSYLDTSSLQLPTESACLFSRHQMLLEGKYASEVWL